MIAPHALSQVIQHLNNQSAQLDLAILHEPTDSPKVERMYEAQSHLLQAIDILRAVLWAPASPEVRRASALPGG